MTKYALCVLAAMLAFPAGASAPGEGARRPVLVELFTSEGCSSCPRADQLLIELIDTQPFPGVELVPLSFHVDYWDRLGWKDPYSSPNYTARQREYARKLEGGGRVFTPQMVVDGRLSVVGSDRGGVRRAVARVVDEPTSSLTLNARLAGTNELAIEIKWSGELPLGGGDAIARVALTEDGLSSEVHRGENRGRTLSHTAVVRSLVELGPAELGETGVSAMSAVLRLGSGWDRERLHVAAWIEDTATGRVLGSGRARVP